MARNAITYQSAYAGIGLITARPVNGRMVGLSWPRCFITHSKRSPIPTQITELDVR